MSKRTKRARRLSVGILAAAVSGALCGPAGDAAVMMDLRIIGASGNIGAPTDKAVTITEGGTVTVGVFVKGLEPTDFGIGSFNYSVRSFGETHNNGAAWPTAPSPTDTVVNATAASLSIDTRNYFTAAPTPGLIKDIHATIGNPDPNDTDLDLMSAGATQQDGQPGGYLVGLGVGDTWVQLGTVTFTALDLDDAARPFNRQVQLNLYYTSGASNGGVMIKGLTNGNTDDSNGVAGTNLISSASQIGANVVVTVSQLITGNTSKLWVGPVEPTESMQQTSTAVDFGRVMKGSATGTSVNLNKNGADATTATVTTNGAATYGGTSPLNISAGEPLVIPVPVGLDTSAVGARSGQVIIDNDATTSGGVSRGSDNGNAIINVSGTVVEQRVVTAGPVNLGRVIKGTDVSGTYNADFSTTGLDSEKTRITVNGQLFNGPMTVSLPVAGSAPNVQNSGQWASLPVTPEGLPGEGTYANVVVNYNAEAVEKRQVSINATQVLPVDLGGAQFLAGRSVNLSGVVLLDSPGTHAEKTDVLVGGTLFNTNIEGLAKNFQVTVSGGGTGTAAIPVVTAENGGLGLPGEGTYPDVNVPYVAHVGEATAKSTNNYGEFGPAQTGIAGPSYAGLRSKVAREEGGGGGGGMPLLGSEAVILAGTASNPNAVVSMKWRSRVPNDGYLNEADCLLSDVLDLTGIAPAGKGNQQTDVFVLQMSYDDRLIPVLYEMSEEQLAQRGALFLGALYLGADGELGGTGSNHDWWVNAVSLNFGQQDVKFMGIGPWNGDMTLGHYGVDIENNVVWAVVNHNSQFAVVPEPSGLLLGIAGLAMLGFINWRRHRRTASI